MKVPFLDLTVSNTKIKKELLTSVEEVLSHGRIILGPEVQKFEEKIAEYCYRKFAVGTNSGTDALYFALRALDIGVGDEVITTPLSWIATVNAIVLTGAKPVFVDVRNDLNINPDLIKDAITKKTKAILPVHFTGNMCDMSKVNDIAQRNNLIVVEDAAQAFGSKLNDKPSGSFGHIACFSMNPMKVLNAYGEAGAIVTDDKIIYEKLVSLRYAGTINKEDCHFPSLNGRIDTIQTAMLLVVMKYVDDKINSRRKIANYYNQEISDIVGCPISDKTCFHSYYSYTITTDNRDELQLFLANNGIETKIQHPILMPYHTAYKGKYKPIIPIAEKLVKQILCLPAHENLDKRQQDYVISKLKKFYS